MGLTQALSDGTNTYIYGNGRIAQTHSGATEYFLGDALGSVRQLINNSGVITYARAYDPYGVVTTTSGSSQSAYGYTGEFTSNSLVYLRARYYAPAYGRFLTRDIWGGDVNLPMSFNRWMYGYGNPVKYMDPTGYISCENSNDVICTQKVGDLRREGESIKSQVTNGSLLPVEGFAQFADFAYSLFEQDIQGTVWAMTLTINGFDANQGNVWSQAFDEKYHSSYWLGYDWLPYENRAGYNKLNWDGNRPWIHSRRGDWKVEYWDKTANQAFHFWYFVAITFFDGSGGSWYGHAANIGHEVIQHPLTLWPDIHQLNDQDAPPVAGKTREDWKLSLAGIHLGQILDADRDIENYIECALPGTIFYSYTKPGTWIRSNLK